jgi:hypothetical protein
MGPIGQTRLQMPMLVVMALYVSMISSASLFHFIANADAGNVGLYEG